MIQGTSYNGPLPIYAGGTGNQTPLAAGGQVSVSIPLQRFFPRNPATSVSSVLAQVQIVHTAETNVMYVAEVDLSNSSATFIRVNVRQVGSAAGAGNWFAVGSLIDLGDLVSG